MTFWWHCFALLQEKSHFCLAESLVMTHFTSEFDDRKVKKRMAPISWVWSQKSLSVDLTILKNCVSGFKIILLTFPFEFCLSGSYQCGITRFDDFLWASVHVTDISQISLRTVDMIAPKGFISSTGSHKSAVSFVSVAFVCNHVQYISIKNTITTKLVQCIVRNSRYKRTPPLHFSHIYILILGLTHHKMSQEVYFTLQTLCKHGFIHGDI